jgi:spermidine synthase
MIFTNNNYIDKMDFVEINYKNNKKLFSKKSKYQMIDVYKNDFLGNILVIDDDLQLTEHDESNYHEMISHVPLNYIPNAKRVLIIGGGDGGTLREVCKHNNVKEIYLIEIDEEVINVSKKYFKNTSKSFDDKRLNLVIEDGYKWVKKNKKDLENYFDVIIVDSTDYNTALKLFSKKFYKMLNDIMKINGILTFNCMGLSWEKEDVDEVIKDMKKNYKYVNLYQVFIPTYASGHYTFCFNSNTIDPMNTPIDIEKFKNKNIDTKYYNIDIHKSSFYLPNEYLKEEKKERLGSNLLIDIKKVNFDLLNDLDYLTNLMLDICKLYNLNIISDSYSKFEPYGVTINFLLSESHFTLHTWPEKGKICLDLFSCGKFKWNFKNNNNKINIIDILSYKLKVKKENIKVNWLDREI